MPVGTCKPKKVVDRFLCRVHVDRHVACNKCLTVVLHGINNFPWPDPHPTILGIDFNLEKVAA